MKKYYIFDLDGTLCDSMGYWRAETEFIEDFANIEIMESAYEKMTEHYRREVRMKDGAWEFLEEARKNNVKMCIATGTRRNVAQPFLDKTGLMGFMEFYIDCHEIRAFKEKPDIYLLAAERLGARISECAVFEDAEYSARTAKKAGFFVAGVIDKITALDGDVRNFSDIVIEDWRNVPLAIGGI